MTTPYPIVTEQALDPTPKRGVLGLGQRTRTVAELPRAAAHHRLVYRVPGGHYVMEDQAHRLSDDAVINATSVSVVDMRPDAEAVVELRMPSADASEFLVRVTFVCTVADPVAVVRNGVNAAAVLDAYLKGYRKLYEIGLDFATADVNEVRRTMNAHLTAHSRLRPPQVLGMTARLTSVEVTTPQELIEFEKTRRGTRRGYLLDSEKEDLEVKLRHQREEGLFTLRDRTGRNQRELDEEKLAWQRADALTKDRSERQQRQEESAFLRGELRETAEMVRDPTTALMLAYHAGQIDAQELADRLTALERSKHDSEQLALERDRDDRRTDQAVDRELELARLEQARADARSEREEQRTERLRQEEAARADREHQRTMEREQLRWSREDEARQESARLEFKRWKHDVKRDAELRDREEQLQRDVHRLNAESHRLDRNLETFKDLVKSGHLDYANLDRYVAELVAPFRNPSDSAPALDGSGDAADSLEPVKDTEATLE